MRVPNRACLIAVALLAAGCQVPGFYPERRELRQTGSVPAERTAVFDRSPRWFAPHGYTVVDDFFSSLSCAQARWPDCP